MIAIGISTSYGACISARFGVHQRSPISILLPGFLAGYSVLIKKLAKTKDEQLKRNLVPVRRFVQSEIRRRLNPERLKEMLAGFSEGELEVERSQTSGEEPGITELIVTKEMTRTQADRYPQPSFGTGR